LRFAASFAGTWALPSSRARKYEADDIIGTLARAFPVPRGLRNVLVTRDKDLSQLIRDGDVFWDYTGNHPISLPRHRAAFRRDARAHRGFFWP